MTPHPHSLRRIGSFLTIGGEELAAARLLSEAGLPRQAAFQAQQCVEKHIRALIEAEGRRAGPTHNIRELAQILGADHALYGRCLALEDLGVAATRYRYPTGSGGLAGLPSAVEFAHVLADIETLRTEVIGFLDQRRCLSKG